MVLYVEAEWGQESTCGQLIGLYINFYNHLYVIQIEGINWFSESFYFIH
jgi:hypothetical protein